VLKTVGILLLQTVSIAIASASVVAGVVYYALQLRHQTKMRKTSIRVHMDINLKAYGNYYEI